MADKQLKADGELRRKMGFFGVMSIGVGAVVGDGVFLMVADGAANAGPACVVSYMIAGVFLFCVSMSCVELAIGMPKAGGLHDWNKRMLGPRWGVVAAFGNAAMNLIFLGSVGLGVGFISNHFFMFTSNETTSAVIWGIIILIILYFITLTGGDVTGKVQFGLIILLVGIMVVFTIAGLCSGRVDSGNLHPFAPFGFKGIWLGIMAGVYAFMGPMSLLTTSGEIKKASILPKAMLWTFIMILAIYLSAMLVCLGMVNYQEYSTMASPFTVAAEFVFGNAAGMIINIGAWIACVTCLLAEYFTVSRVLYGMAEEKAVPKFFMKANKNGVPSNGLTFGLIVGICLIFMAVIPALETLYTILGGMSCACGVMCMFFTVISGWIYKKKFPEEHAALEWHLPARNVICCLGLIGTILLFAASFTSSIQTLVAMIIVFIIFILYYEFYTKPRTIGKE